MPPAAHPSRFAMPRAQREGSWGDDDNIVFAATNDGGFVARARERRHAPSRHDAGSETARDHTSLSAGAAGRARSLVREQRRPRGRGHHRSTILTDRQAQNSDPGGSLRTLSAQRAPGLHAPRHAFRGAARRAPPGTDRISRRRCWKMSVSLPGTGAAGFTFSQSGIFVYVAPTRRSDAAHRHDG